MSRVKINVSGTHYEFDSKILETRKYHTLTKMCRDANSADTPLEFFVDRPSDCFAAVLSFYQTDELHMPASVCPKAFRKELNFWGVAETDLEKCCLYRYYTFHDDLETHERFRKETFANDLRECLFIPAITDSRLKRLRRRIWRVIEFKEKSICAKIYHILVFLMVLLCILTLAFSTVPSFQRKLSKCELLEYLEHSGHKAAEIAREKIGDVDCSSNFFQDEEYNDYSEWYWDEYSDYYYYSDDNSTNSTSTKISLPQITIRLLVFEVLEIITAAFFTVDLLLRLSTCPSFLRFLRSVINIFDILAVVGFYIHTIVINTEKQHKYELSLIRSIDYLQIFRVMRLFRFVKHVRASRVLTFSLRQNCRDMTLLVLLVLIGVSTSASLIYFIEDKKDIESIPVGWYWAMITLTTVGYGDITPKTGFGRFVAAILAICGVMLLAITLPMFVNNFLTLYQYSCLDDAIKERTDERRKLKGVGKVAMAVQRKTTDSRIENKDAQNDNGSPKAIFMLSYEDNVSLKNDNNNQSS